MRSESRKINSRPLVISPPNRHPFRHEEILNGLRYIDRQCCLLDPDAAAPQIQFRFLAGITLGVMQVQYPKLIASELS